jgi:hypothetical protein
MATHSQCVVVSSSALLPRLPLPLRLRALLLPLLSQALTMKCRPKLKPIPESKAQAATVEEEVKRKPKARRRTPVLAPAPAPAPAHANESANSRLQAAPNSRPRPPAKPRQRRSRRSLRNLHKLTARNSPVCYAIYLSEELALRLVLSLKAVDSLLYEWRAFGKEQACCRLTPDRIHPSRVPVQSLTIKGATPTTRAETL